MYTVDMTGTGEFELEGGISAERPEERIIFFLLCEIILSLKHDRRSAAKSLIKSVRQRKHKKNCPFFIIFKVGNK